MNIIQLIKSFRYAFEGIQYALKHNQNLRIHFLAAIVVIVASFIFHLPEVQFWIIMVMVVFSVFAEMVNTAIEQMTDLITTEHRKEAKIAKDVSAGMVLLVACTSIVIAIGIFVPHILIFFGI